MSDTLFSNQYTLYAIIAVALIKAATDIIVAIINRPRQSAGTAGSTTGASASGTKAYSTALKSLLGLAAIISSTSTLALFQFSELSAAALTAGSAASIAQSLCLFASGVWLFSRG